MSNIIKKDGSSSIFIPTSSDDLLGEHISNYPAPVDNFKSSTSNLYPFYVYPSEKVKDDKPWALLATLNDLFTLNDPLAPKGSDKEVKLYNKEEEPISILGFTGTPFLIELQPGIKWYNSEEKKFHNICSVIASEYNGTLINTLPKIPFNTMYNWDSIKNKTYNQPSNEVQALGLMGSRGQMCADCITSGKSLEVDEKGKQHQCEVTGFLYMVVTGIPIVVAKTVNGVEQFSVKDRSVSQLKYADGSTVEPFIVAIRLTGSSLSRGWHTESNLRIQNITQYHKSLRYEPTEKDEKPNLLKDGDPRMNLAWTPIQIVAKRYYNKDNTPSMKPIVAIHQRLSHNDKEYEEAMSLWKGSIPNLEIKNVPYPVSTPTSIESSITATYVEEDDENW
jgi:hypothetical protein